MKTGKCKLCGNKRELCDSHIIPNFVGKWLKDTSVTGFLRQAVNANVRRQDLIKVSLLCRDCEILFSSWETKFKKEVFDVYVDRELNQAGSATGTIKSIPYDEWLLKFIISLQWRCLITDNSLNKFKELSNKKKEVYKKLLCTIKNDWLAYLNGSANNSGESRHYVIFLQNLAFGSGYLPENINDHVNIYLLRSVDTTLAMNKRKMILYTKLGPIVIISALKPSKLNKLSQIRIKKKGSLNTVQNISDPEIGNFVIVDRPNEAMSRYKLSEKQSKLISNDITKKVSGARQLNQIYAIESDRFIRYVRDTLDNKDDNK